MQKIVVKEVTPSTAENKPTVIVTEDGSKMSGFDFALRSVNPGDVLEIEVEIKKGYTNITAFKVLDKGSAPAPRSNGYPDMSKEDWENKQRIERESIESQTAIKVLPDLLTLDTVAMDEKGKAVYGKALLWCEAKIDANMPKKLLNFTSMQPKETEPQVTETPAEGLTFKNVGEFLQACDNAGVPRPKVIEKLGVNEKTLPNINTTDAWQVIFEEIIKPSKELMK